MNKNHNLLTGFILLAVILLTACKNQNTSSYRECPGGIVFKLKKGNLDVKVISSAILQCRYYLTDTTIFRKSLMVVDQKSPKAKWSFEESANAYVIKTSEIKAEINRETGLISFFDVENKPILHENNRTLTPAFIAGENVYHLSQTFGLTPDEAIYGLGQSQKGYMNLRNDSLKLYQKNKEDYVPLIVSTNGYGIFWENYSYTLYKDNSNGLNLWSELGDGINYYFIYGPSMDTVIAHYRNLTGGCPMLPKWAFGYVHSQDHYKTQDEVLNVVKEYRNRQIPLDLIVQDWQYWPQGQWGQKSFDPVRYPNPLKMTTELHQKYHAKVMISIWGLINKDCPDGKEIINTPGSNYYHVNADEIYYDPFNQVSADLYWKQCNEGIFSRGFDAWWSDATEPEIDHAFVISADSVRKKMTTSIGSGSRYMCAFPLMHSKNMYENQRKTTTEKRVVDLTRSAFGGQQRYSTIIWSGDIMASWDGFRKQITAGLNFCSSGIPYWTTDIGAFYINPRGSEEIYGPGGYELGTADDEYKELYLRWFQFGAFCPMFREHGTHYPREVWRFGEPGTWCYDALLKMDNLRYRLLPYIYSVGWMITDNGYTMMRPLAFDFRNDKKVYNITDQYMFGPAFMVNPVTETQYHKSKGNLSEVIPSSALFVDDKNGLKGEYFNGMNFEKKITERIDTAINFTWHKNPAQGVDEDFFSVLWTGQILTKEEGEYYFTTANDDGARLWVNNKLIVDDWNNHGTQFNKGIIALKANTRYDIKLEYYDYNRDAVIKLSWFLYKKPEEADIKEVKSRQVYLPENAAWLDFWTGERIAGNKTIDAPTPVDQIPLYIKAGSIVPMGPFMQYSNEKSSDPIELRVYAGVDADFTLYEDENDNYNYEKGNYTTIPIHWDDKAQTLTVDKRAGEFKGMLAKRTFQVVFVGMGHGCGIETTKKADRQITYTGEKITVNK